MEPTRRDVIRFGGIGAMGLVAAGVLRWTESIAEENASDLPARNMPRPFQAAFTVPPLLPVLNTTTDPDGTICEHYTISEQQGVVRILPGGLTTRVWGYNGIAPGPTISTRRGRRTEVLVRNRFPEFHPTLGHEFTTSVHLHGSPSKPQYDGYASDVTRPGFRKLYKYPGFEPARTLWYHDHAVHHTAENAYSGLAAQYHVHDVDEERLLPQGEFDVPVTVRDAMFRADGELAFDDHSFVGLFGDVILVNGQPWPVMRVKRRVYRFRILNAGITRSYRLRLSDSSPVTMVATDGGLMPKSQTVTTWRHGVAERYEILIDFGRYKAGTRVALQNLSNPHNIDYVNTDKVMAFDVTDDPFDESDPTAHRIPGDLVDVHVMNLTAGQAKRKRRLEFRRDNGEWTINGLTWQDVINSKFQQLIADPDLNDIEIWEIANKSGGWNHPVHIHLIDFKILDRNGRAPFAYERGPKDVVYLGENETVRVIMQFGPEQGRYMVHCHNLVHEDHDMMHQFGVGFKPGQADPNDPINAAPPEPDTGP